MKKSRYSEEQIIAVLKEHRKRPVLAAGYAAARISSPTMFQGRSSATRLTG